MRVHTRTNVLTSSLARLSLPFLHSSIVVPSSMQHSAHPDRRPPGLARPKEKTGADKSKIRGKGGKRANGQTDWTLKKDAGTAEHKQKTSTRDGGRALAAARRDAETEHDMVGKKTTENGQKHIRHGRVGKENRKTNYKRNTGNSKEEKRGDS